MLTLFTKYYTEILSGVLIAIFCFLVYVFVFRKQNKTVNWGVFYATLYTTVALPIINYFCVKQGLWLFTAGYENSIHLPYDLYFIWVILWAVVPVYFLKGKHWLFVSVFLFWLDLILMPILEKFGVLQLNNNWLLGELLLLGFVFVPSYLWANASITNKHITLRAILQVTTMSFAFLIGLPFILSVYGCINYTDVQTSPFITQLFIIIVFPSLVAVVDLVQKGKGTPFPYDKTQQIVQTGVYAYIRNPIQWSFTLMFIPLAIYYSSYYLLIGSAISMIYTYTISDMQEYEDMEQRFGKQWLAYKKSVPKWFFLWQPKHIPKGTIYFNAACNQCNQINQWFSKSKAINLEIKPSYLFPNNDIVQATYIDHNNKEYKSIQAIACALEHINLAYATLGWFLRFPIISFVLQAIIDSMNFKTPEELCETKQH